MKNIYVFCLIFFSAMVIMAQEKRVALVIGNSAYTNNPLRNPANDATLMEATLKSLGFEVIKRTNASKMQMEAAVQQFSEKLSKAKVALFYYAGHGVQSNGMNYLIPVDAKLDKEADLKYQAVSVNFVVDEFEQYPDNTNIVILDACRDNPLKTWQASRGGQRGFKAIAPTSGTIIAFATSEGSTAADGTGSNGLFTEKLVKQMKQPVPIESVFKNTRKEVELASGGKQSPQEWTKLKGDFYFVKNNGITQEKQEIITEAKTNDNNVSMTEEALTGTLRITSDIEGEFYIDGISKGNFSKGKVYTLKNITVGSHDLKVDKWSENVTIEQDKTTEVQAKPDLPNQFIDERDNKEYKIVKIGNQTWMAENLNYISNTSWCYEDKTSNCDKYGRLYNWKIALNVCPRSWHLPSDDEWSQLTDNLGNESVAGEKMKEEGTTHWDSPNKDADNSSGFTGLPGGNRNDKGSFDNIGYYGIWWSATEYDATNAWRRRMYYDNAEVYRYKYDKAFGLSVRCLKD